MKAFTVFAALAVVLVPAWGQAPEPAPPLEPPVSSDRKIGPQDLLQIVIVGESNLPAEYRVSADGKIQFPFLDVVEVKGLTPRELDLELERLLSIDYFVNPEVLVTVKEYRQEYVRIIGQVNRPGQIPFRAEQKMDILDAIAAAGGTTRLARKDLEFTRDGVRQTLSIEKLKRETDPAKKIWLQPGDLIDVRETIW